jgi:hypothetical protein
MKCNEAGAFRKTYDHIIGRLKDEKRHFDVQLAQAMDTLRAKEADLAELIQMSNDAHRAKESAKSELAKLELTIAEERKIRQKELAERRKLVQARLHDPRARVLLRRLRPRDSARSRRCTACVRWCNTSTSTSTSTHRPPPPAPSTRRVVISGRVGAQLAVARSSIRRAAHGGDGLRLSEVWVSWAVMSGDGVGGVGLGCGCGGWGCCGRRRSR